MTLTFDLPWLFVRIGPVQWGGPDLAQDFNLQEIALRGGQRSLWDVLKHPHKKSENFDCIAVKKFTLCTSMV